MLVSEFIKLISTEKKPISTIELSGAANCRFDVDESVREVRRLNEVFDDLHPIVHKISHEKHHLSVHCYVAGGASLFVDINFSEYIKHDG